MKWPWPFSLVERFSRFLLNIPNSLLSVAGGLTLVFSLIVSAMIDRKDIAVAVAMAGTFVGTALLSFFLPKFLYAMREEEVIQAAKDAESKQKLVEEERKNREIEKRLADAKQEITRLESMRINLDAFRSVLKLGLLEIDMHITHFDRKPIGFTEGSWLRKDQEHVYVGVVEQPIHAQLGIDLGRVRLRQESDGRLVVSNIIFSRVIDALEMPERPLEEIRTEFKKGGKVVEVQADPIDSRLLEETRAHEGRVKERLKQGQDFKCFEHGVVRAAEQTLKAFLGPISNDIVISEESSGEGEDVLSFLKKHNDRLQVKIEEQRNAQRQLPPAASASTACA